MPSTPSFNRKTMQRLSRLVLLPKPQVSFINSKVNGFTLKYSVTEIFSVTHTSSVCNISVEEEATYTQNFIRKEIQRIRGRARTGVNHCKGLQQYCLSMQNLNAENVLKSNTLDSQRVSLNNKRKSFEFYKEWVIRQSHFIVRLLLVSIKNFPG